MTMLRRIGVSLLGVALTALIAAPAAAQDQVAAFGPDSGQTPPRGGWTFTPSMVYSAGWDDNVLIRGEGDDVQSDVVNVLGPRADLTYLSGRAQLTANYSGGFQRYRTMDTLNSYDQHLSAYARRMLTKHFALFVKESYSATPTTQMLQLIGVPYVRTGSQVNDLRGGFEQLVSKRLSLTASYDLQWVKFDAAAFGIALFGGHSQGGTVSLKYLLDDRTALTGDGDLQFATVNGPAANLSLVALGVTGGVQSFTTQNGWFGVERKIDDTLRVFGAAGLSHLAISDFAPSRTGPAWRVGASKSYERTAIDVVYSRSFVPSFGFGGTLQNEEFTARAHRPLTRRTYVAGGFAWMRNEPLVPGQLRLASMWVDANVGYTVSQWLRVEGYYGRVHQSIDRPGGLLTRSQFGVQIVTAKPMRIQ